MICPVCSAVMMNLPKDHLVNYVCRNHRCGFLATTKYMDELTPEKIEALKDEEAKTRMFRVDMDAKREAEKIERQAKKIEMEKGIGDIVREHKKIKSIEDFTNARPSPVKPSREGK